MSSSIQAVFDMEVTPKPVFKYEPLWDSNTFSPKNTTPPLIELAAKQKPSNQDLLYLLSQNARTLYFLTSFPLRITHPLETLFPSSVRTLSGDDPVFISFEIYPTLLFRSPKCCFSTFSLTKRFTIPIRTKKSSLIEAVF